MDKAQSELADVRGPTDDPKLERQDEAAQRDSLDRRLAGLRAEVGAIASNLSPALGSEFEVCFFIGLAVCTNLSVHAHQLCTLWVTCLIIISIHWLTILYMVFITNFKSFI